MTANIVSALIGSAVYGALIAWVGFRYGFDWAMFVFLSSALLALLGLALAWWVASLLEARRERSHRAAMRALYHSW